MRLWKNIIIFLAIVDAFTGRAAAFTEEPIPIVLNQKQVEKINRKAVYFIDTTNTSTFDAAVHGNHDWQHPDSDSVALDLNSSTAWIKLRFNNPSSQPTQAAIELNPVFLEWITVYDEAGHILDRTGSKVEPTRLDAFPTLIFNAETGTHDVFISIKSRANGFAMILRSPKEHAEKSKLDQGIICTLFGCLASLLIYHLFLFATYRRRNYLYYSIFMASALLFTVAFTSYHRQVLPAKILGFGTDFWWSGLATPVMFFCIYLFSADLLGLFPYRASPRRRIAFALLALPIVDCLCLVLAVATDHPAVLVPIRLAAVIHILCLPTIAIFLWRRNRSNVMALYYAVSWIPFAAGTVMIILWLSGVVEHRDIFAWSIPMGTLVQSLLLSFAAGQRLKTRDRVISAYVSSDIVAELDRGDDPLAFTPRTVEKSVVFMDMLDFTTLSETHTPNECHEVLNKYFEIINRTTFNGSGIVEKIIGDAVMLKFDDPVRCLSSIVQLRRNISSLNKTRSNAGLFPIKFGAGISCGPMLAANFGTFQKFDRTLIGDTVNVASRLETITRAFAVDVLCSKEFFDLHPQYQYFRPAGYVLLKGRAKKSLVYEIFEHNLPEVVAWKISTRPIISRVVDLELAGEYVDAIRLLRELIKKCPPHSYKPNVTMDPTLESMVSSIEDKMRQLGLKIPKLAIANSTINLIRKVAK